MLTSPSRVRSKIRSYEAGYESSMFARALYAGYSGDPKNLEEGFLKSSMMVKVRTAAWILRMVLNSP